MNLEMDLKLHKEHEDYKRYVLYHKNTLYCIVLFKQ